ncbi:DUF3068 domain-containing protein [Sphaerisporangium sp. NPDC005289]|uniref:DUF3068 domain-containing protein n=1 Tax=Sphaerisporangium sp. NPDC005289 TaxID=3155247 RepID=UPI0033B6CC46
MTRAQLVRTTCYVVVAFMVTMAVLFRSYVYPNGLKLPLEQRRVYHLGAEAATYLDTATFQLRAGVPVTDTVSLYGDPVAGDDRTAVWVEFSSLETAYGQRIDYHERRTAFDRRTGMAVACCGEYIDDDTAVRQTGLAFRLPYGAEPRGYPIFDPVLKREVALRYEGEDTVEGLPVRRYGYTVGPAKVEDLPDQVPGKVLGLPASRPLNVARYVRITRTLWVEPESGLPVRVREQRTDTLRTPDQVDRVVSFQADLVTDAGDVQAQAAEAAGFRRWAVVIRDVMPVAFLVLALVPIVVALRTRRRPRGPDRARGPDDATPPGGATSAGREDQAPAGGGTSAGRDDAAPPGGGTSAAAQDQQQVPGHDLADAG